MSLIDADGGVTCARCGAVRDGPPPLTWSTAVEDRNGSRVILHYCEQCSRENVRSIEGRLDEAWW